MFFSSSVRREHFIHKSCYADIGIKVKKRGTRPFCFDVWKTNTFKGIVIISHAVSRHGTTLKKWTILVLFIRTIPVHLIVRAFENFLVFVLVRGKL
jgi:hypothetical protein